jgi:hypothetical protein
VDGQATLTAPNRDQLEASIKGTLNPQTGKAVLTYEWTRGTGRFQNVSGTTVWLVQVNPPDPLNPDQTYDVVADGARFPGEDRACPSFAGTGLAQSAGFESSLQAVPPQAS